MNDFWEILGRMVLDAGIRNGVVQAFAPGDLERSLNATGQGALFTAMDAAAGVRTRGAAYAKMRAATDPHLRMHRTSLMTLGEWMRVLTLAAESRDAILASVQAVALHLTAHPELVAPASPGYCTVLGAMVVDAQLRDQIRSGTAGDFADGLTEAEELSLNALALDETFGDLSDGVCSVRDGWDAGCSVRALYYDQHAYPLPQVA